MGWVRKSPPRAVTTIQPSRVTPSAASQIPVAGSVSRAAARPPAGPDRFGRRSRPEPAGAFRGAGDGVRGGVWRESVVMTPLPPLVPAGTRRPWPAA
jgi:hypothetical protein